MTYNKPSNVTYTDMCIWIDTNMYEDNCDDIKLYEYLYHILNMFARKSSYFSRSNYYDDFALMSASRLYMRIRNEKLTKIKSILNYIKTVIYPYKVEFEKELYVNNTEDNDLLYTDNVSLSTTLVEDSDIFDKIEFRYTLDSISTMIRRFLNKIPHNNKNAEWLNIYTSVLLTFNNMIGSACDKKSKLETMSSKDLHALYLDISSQEPILYHLNKNYSNYIAALVNQIKALVAKQLSIENSSKISSETALKSVIIASMDLED